MVIPKHFFVPEIIEKRNPLSPVAKRAEWVGCNILVQNIPHSGRIFYVKNGIIENKNNVLAKWKKTLFLKEEKQDLKGWLLDIMNCVDRLEKREFSLSEIYGFEDFLNQKHPNNRHVKDKIRKQLQFLRDKGYLEFAGKGYYRLK